MLAFRSFILALLWSSSLAAPVVVKSEPAHGARAVDPETAFIRVTFSEPMQDRSWSWCGGGILYPEITNSPFYEDERTVVLPVKLQAQRTYQLMINCDSARNFRSAQGESVEPTLLRFTTTWGDPLTAVSEPTNLVATDALRKLLEENYSYADRLGPEWRAAFEEERPFLLAASSVTEWGWRLQTLLERFQDKHLWVAFPDGISYRPWWSPSVMNANYETIERRLGPFERPSNLVWSRRNEDIAFIAIHSWSSAEEDTTLIHRLIDEAAGVPVMILDVRANGGGDEVQARSIAARFLAEGEAGTYARNRLRDPQQPDGWTPWYDRRVEAASADRHYPGRVFLLQGQVCLSSNESFIKMMRLSPRVTTVGATTGGSSARPQRHTLPNGVTINLATWWSLLPDGTLLEGNGIAPHVPVEGDFVADDPVFAKVMELIESE